MLVFLIVLFSGHLVYANEHYQELKLYGREENRVQSIPLTKEQRDWLRQKNEIVLGTSNPDHAPFDITTSGVDFEGITADYLALIASMLEVKATVRVYPNREQAIQALNTGEIDLIAGANAFEVHQQPFSLTHHYVPDRSAFFLPKIIASRFPTAMTSISNRSVSPMTICRKSFSPRSTPTWHGNSTRPSTPR